MFDQSIGRTVRDCFSRFVLILEGIKFFYSININRIVISKPFLSINFITKWNHSDRKGFDWHSYCRTFPFLTRLFLSVQLYSSVLADKTIETIVQNPKLWERYTLTMWRLHLVWMLSFQTCWKLGLDSVI